MTDRMSSLEVALATLGATLSTKLDALLVTVERQATDHETRLRKLEIRPTPDGLVKRVEELEQRASRAERGWYVLLGAAIVLGGTAGGLVQTVVP